MLSLSTQDFLFAGLTAVVFILLPSLFKKSNQLFRVTERPHWIVGAASVFAIYWNPTLDMVNTRLVIENGYSGLWFLKDNLLIIGIAPVLFAPLWAKLNLTTDNQIIPLRFSGTSGKFLQKFRAIYVGVFVAAIICSFYTLGIYKIFASYFTFTDTQFFIGFGLFSVLIISKNSLALKIKTDTYVSLLYIVVIPLAIYYLLESFGGWDNMRFELLNNHPDKISLSPPENGTGESWINAVVFMTVQWWSLRILDDSSVNTQRYFALKDPWKAFKAIFIPVIIISIAFGFSSFIWDAAIIKNIKLEQAEASYILLLSESLPSGLKGVLLITFTLGFVSNYEAIVSWGGSMITVDLLKYKEGEHSQTNNIGYLAMLFIAALSMILAIYSSNIYLLIKLMLSISIGVGPVFFLRWFWWRINAWSQFSAMIASFIFSVGFDFYYNNYEAIFLNTMIDQYEISWYVLKIIIITPIVTIIWLTTTFLTPADDALHLKTFVKLSGTGGFWPFDTAPFYWRKKFLTIILFAFVGLLPLWIIWLIKFQSGSLGLALVLVWLILLSLIFFILKKIFFLPEK